MEKYNLTNDLKVFGVQVKSFPQGIGEAFNELSKTVSHGNRRPYYGVSECTKQGIIYKAATLEMFDGEGVKCGCDSYIIEKGEYLAVTVLDWRKKTESIKSVFEEMFKDERSDRSKPCIEIYINDDEMKCLVKQKP